MQNQPNDLKVSSQKLQEMINSSEGQKLLQLLQKDGGKQLQMAIQAAKGGDYQKAIQDLQPVISSKEANRLLQDLKNKHG